MSLILENNELIRNYYKNFRETLKSFWSEHLATKFFLIKEKTNSRLGKRTDKVKKLAKLEGCDIDDFGSKLEVQNLLSVINLFASMPNMGESY